MSNSPPPAKRVKVEDEDTFEADTEVTFEVVVDRQHFTLNCEKFCQRSKVFSEKLAKAAASLDDKENAQPITLRPGFDTNEFDIYVRCVGSGKPALPKFHSDDDDAFLSLLKLYVAADWLRDLATANLAIDKVIWAAGRFQRGTSPEEITYVWWAIRDYETPIRKLFVDLQIHQMDSDTLIVEFSDVPFEYIVDVAWKMKKLMERQGPRGERGQEGDCFAVPCGNMGKCYYHQHDENHPACS